jgi:hypothetical protein
MDRFRLNDYKERFKQPTADRSKFGEAQKTLNKEMMEAEKAMSQCFGQPKTKIANGGKGCFDENGII